MKLIDKQARCNSETYTPELLVTVSIPWELMNSDAMPGEDAMYYEIIGEKFINILKSLTKQSAADSIFMNERIRKLLNEAVVAVDIVTGNESLDDELAKMYIPDCFAEKFAELIVRECAEICLEANDHKNILRHFGVEE